MQAKYVVVEHNLLELAVVFNKIFNHSDFDHLGKILGAGQCFIADNGEVTCYGNSITLGIKSREKLDADAIKRSFRDDF
jgi:hypothetical protein